MCHLRMCHGDRHWCPLKKNQPKKNSCYIRTFRRYPRANISCCRWYWPKLKSNKEEEEEEEDEDEDDVDIVTSVAA